MKGKVFVRSLRSFEYLALFPPKRFSFESSSATLFPHWRSVGAPRARAPFCPATLLATIGG